MIKILVVDDQDINIRVLEAGLADLPYKLHFALNGEAALKVAEQINPDLVLLDIMMPDLDGYQVCKRLRSSSWGQNTPIIFVSALGESVDKVRALESGGTDFLTKPFSIDELRARIKVQLRLADTRKHFEKKYEDNQMQFIHLMLSRDLLLNELKLSIKTPLSIIKNDIYLIALLNKQSESRILRNSIQRSGGAVDEIDKLTQITLDTILKESWGLANFHLVDVALLIEQVIRPLRGICKKKHINLVIKLERGIPTNEVYLDEEAIAWALKSLITKAIKNSRAGGTIRISGELTAKNVQIQITNTSFPRSNDFTDHILRFNEYIAHEEIDLTEMDIELYGASKILQSHNGKIIIKNETGKGTSITLLIPQPKTQPETTR